jgi:energy-coupling factor transport system permease protein
VTAATRPTRRRTWLHRVSPLPKLAWLAAGLAVLLLTYDPAVLAAAIGIGAVLCLSAKAGRTAAGTVVALAPVSASIIVLQALAPVACRWAECAPLASIGPLTIYAEGLSYALVLAARLVALELVTVAVVATTDAADLFAALRGIRIPYELALMAMLSLQLLPQLRVSFDDTLDAQRSRGLRTTGLRALVPLLVPVTAATFDRLSVLVLSLQARGLGAGPRTSWREVRLGAAGITGIALAAVAGVAGAGFAAARWGAGSGTVVLPPGAAVAVVLGSAAVFVVVMASGFRWLVRR